MRLVAPILAAFALLMPATSFAESCDKPANLVPSTAPYSLHGICLAFSLISSGMRLPLGSIIFVPVQERKPILTLSIERALLSKRFIENVFEHPDDNLLTAHPLAWPGIALTLNDSRLRLAIYSGVICTCAQIFRTFQTTARS
jgi:hypothetical protein